MATDDAPETPGPIPAPLVRREDLAAAVAELHATRESIDAAVKTAVDTKAKRWRNVFIGMAVALGLALGGVIGLAIVAYQASQDRDDLADLIDAQQSDLLQRRIDACERDNTTRGAARLIATTTAVGFNQFAAILIGDQEIDAELQAQIDAFQKNVIDPFVNLTDAENGPFKDRDCTAAALQVAP